MESIGELATVLAFLAFLVEALTERFIASWLGKVIEDEDTRAVVLSLAASVVGIVLTFAYKLDLVGVAMAGFGVVPGYSDVAWIAGTILTGLLIGRGAQWFHDLGSSLVGLDGAMSVFRRG